MDESFDTMQVHDCVARWQQGDRAAADELLRAVGGRMENLTRKMLRGFPNVREHTETADVFQASVVRLLSTLQKMRPDSTRHFFNLAAVHIRRELVDLARSFATKRDWKTAPDGGKTPIEELGESSIVSLEDLELWQRFHEAVEQLPVADQEVFCLRFYHGWTHVRIAELFSVDERMIRKRWQAAVLELGRLLGGQLPPL